MPRALKVFVLLLAILATLGVSFASASPAHSHLNSSARGCDICLTAHLAADETPAIQPVNGPVLLGRTTLELPLVNYQPYAGQPCCSRGPPSFSR